MSLTERLGKPGFTPGARDIPELLALLANGDEKTAKLVERSLLKAPEPALTATLAALPTAVRPGRARLVALLGRLVEQDVEASALGELTKTLCELARDPDLKTQLNAVTALGRVAGEESERTLVALWEASPRPELRRALLRSLGKAGSEAARAVLVKAPKPEDPEEARLLEQALLILGRSTSRATAIGKVRGDVGLGSQKIRLSCRAGLEQLLVDEMQEHGLIARSGRPPTVRVGAVEMSFDGSFESLLCLRLMDWMSIAVAVPAGGAVESRVAKAFASPELQALLAKLSEGCPRYRLDWPEASRSQIWDLAKRLTKEVPGAINDPRESMWELQIRGEGKQLAVWISPKRLDDPRFAYRTKDVPASSHPTLAAALARLAQATPKDVVWDPFTGAGTELIEVARRGQVAGLHGSDLSAEAIAIAKANLRAAGVSGANLRNQDSLTVQGLKATLIVTNPPMGRRVARGELKPLLRAFVEHIAKELAPNGRLVWISPLGDATALHLNQVGLAVSYRQRVDMGGFDAELQVASRAPAAKR